MGTVHNFNDRGDNTANPPGGGVEPPMELTERIVRVEEKLSGVDTRLGLVEKDVRDLMKKVDTNFVITWGGMIALGIGLAGLMAKGFHWL